MIFRKRAHGKEHVSFSMGKKRRTVTIIKSDHQRFFAGEKMSFSEADALIGNLEKDKRGQYG